MTWVTLSHSTCPPFFPLEVGIFDLARRLNSRGKKGVSPRQKCREYTRQFVAVLRGKTVTHVMRSCRQPALPRIHRRRVAALAPPRVFCQAERGCARGPFALELF